MYISTNSFLSNLIGGVRVSSEETAFPPQMVSQIFNMVAKNQWIILGGDVVTCDLKHTYDNWYYEPIRDLPLFENTKQSIAKSDQYISEYREKNGDKYLYIFTISSSYVDGKI